jgi:hypothetical protein
MNIYFDKSLKSNFLVSQKLGTDTSGYTVDESTQMRVTDSDKQFIKTKNIGGIRKGSRIFLSEDIDTIIKEAQLSTK